MTKTTLSKKQLHSVALTCQQQAEAKANQLIEFSLVGGKPITEEVKIALRYYAQAGALEAYEYLRQRGMIKLEEI